LGLVVGRQIPTGGRNGRVWLILSVGADLVAVADAQGRTAEGRPALSLEEVETVFDALAHEARRHIILVLAHDGPELPSGYLAKRFSHSWPTTTRHRRVLEAARLIRSRRDGRNCVYRLERERLQHVVGSWLGLLDPPNSDQTWPSPGPRSVVKGTSP
jgi:DNA-binding transcriptional ArsR family regulator